MICDACGHPASMHGTMQLHGHCHADGGDCICPRGDRPMLCGSTMHEIRCVREPGHRVGENVYSDPEGTHWN